MGLRIHRDGRIPAYQQDSHDARKPYLSTARGIGSSPTVAASGQWQESGGHNDLATVLFTICSCDEQTKTGIGGTHDSSHAHGDACACSEGWHVMATI